jgi:hypothetical protein
MDVSVEPSPLVANEISFESRLYALFERFLGEPDDNADAHYVNTEQMSAISGAGLAQPEEVAYLISTLEQLAKGDVGVVERPDTTRQPAKATTVGRIDATLRSLWHHEQAEAIHVHTERAIVDGSYFIMPSIDQYAGDAPVYTLHGKKRLLFDPSIAEDRVLVLDMEEWSRRYEASADDLARLVTAETGDLVAFMEWMLSSGRNTDPDLAMVWHDKPLTTDEKRQLAEDINALQYNQSARLQPELFMSVMRLCVAGGAAHEVREKIAFDRLSHGFDALNITGIRANTPGTAIEDSLPTHLLELRVDNPTGLQTEVTNISVKGGPKPHLMQGKHLEGEPEPMVAEEPEEDQASITDDPADEDQIGLKIPLDMIVDDYEEHVLGATVTSEADGLILLHTLLRLISNRS